MTRVQKAGRRYGKDRHRKVAGHADEYARHIWDLIRDNRTFFTALDGLKGAAPGTDGISPHKLWRWVVYRIWLEYCGLKRPDWPAFQDTTFFTAPPGMVWAALMACRPARLHYRELKALWGLPSETPLDQIPTQRVLGGFQGRIDSKLVPQAGMDPLALKALFQNVAEALLHGLGDVDRRTELVGIPLAKHLRGKANLIYPGLREDADEEGRLTVVALMYEAARWARDSLLTPKADGGVIPYRPGPLRRLEILKPDGTTRGLNLPNATDRMVERATVLVIDPMLESIFVPGSAGCRMERDRFDVLAALARAYPDAEGKWILCVDLKKAFDNVPHAALLEVIDRYIPDERTRYFLKLSVTRPGCRIPGSAPGRGIPQGSPLSPMLLNLLLHDRLDILYLQQKPRALHYIRYVDDIAVFGCRNEHEVLRELDRLAELLRPQGMDLHRTAPKTQWIDLSAHDLLRPRRDTDTEDEDMEMAPEGIDRYLGLGMREREGGDGQLGFFLPHDWRDRAANMFKRAVATATRLGYDGTKGAEKHYRRATQGWLTAFGPAYDTVPEKIVAEGVVKAAMAASPHCGRSFTDDNALKWWRKAHTQWNKRLNAPNLPDLARRPRKVNLPADTCP